MQPISRDTTDVIRPFNIYIIQINYGKKFLKYWNT